MSDPVKVPLPLRERGFGGSMGFGSSPALLIIDFQCGFTDPALPLGADASREIEQTNILIASARERVGFRSWHRSLPTTIRNCTTPASGRARWRACPR